MEDELFADWKRNYPNQTFVIDGAPCPDSFENSPARCLIILKDVNFDPDEEKEEVFNLRLQLASEPHPWWRTVANWCAGISRLHGEPTHKGPTWKELNNEGIAIALAPFAFMQLKKTVGGGSVAVNLLTDYAKRDKAYIRNQIYIYLPRVIICCGDGVGNNVADLLGGSEWMESRRGIPFMKIDLDGHPIFLIDFVHPSARVAKNIVCFGILDAYKEIVLDDNLPPSQ